MAKYALISGGTVVNTVVADSEADLGNFGLIFDIKDISNLDPQPSRGWAVHGDSFIAPKVFGAAKDAWNGAGFDAPKDETKDDSKDDSKNDSKSDDKKGK